MDEYLSLNILLYFHNFLLFALVCRLCMLLRIASVRWFCEVPSIYVLRPPLKKRKEDFLSFFVGLVGGAEEDTYLNFMTVNCQFYINCMNRHVYVTYVWFFFNWYLYFFHCTMCQNLLSGIYMSSIDRQLSDERLPKFLKRLPPFALHFLTL